MDQPAERAPGHVRLGVPSNLPAELSTFVGRADDLERGARLLGESRLVTFTGAGGCGKTRLARQVAARVADRFPGGVWWVELASLADGALVTERVARTLGLQAAETDAVVDYFADRAALLLLDNCEHIAEGVAGSSPRYCAARGGSACTPPAGIPWGWKGRRPGGCRRWRSRRRPPTRPRGTGSTRCGCSWSAPGKRGRR